MSVLNKHNVARADCLSRALLKKRPKVRAVEFGLIRCLIGNLDNCLNCLPCQYTLNMVIWYLPYLFIFLNSQSADIKSPWEDLNIMVIFRQPNILKKAHMLRVHFMSKSCATQLKNIVVWQVYSLNTQQSLNFHACSGSCWLHTPKGQHWYYQISLSFLNQSYNSMLSLK